MLRLILVFLSMVLILSGCSTSQPNIPPLIIEEEDTMIHLEADLRPDTFLFPEYFFMEDFELDQHGHIPDTSLIGIDLKTKLELKEAMRRFNKMLMQEGWTIMKANIQPQFFHLEATKEKESLEIRAVQGTGPTQLFVLYKPID
jgi:hypothetical protein